MLTNIKAVSVVLATISYLGVNLVNINLLSLQPMVQVGGVANANPAARKFLIWAAKAAGTGALSAAGAFGFNQAVARASQPKPVQQRNRTYIGSNFTSKNGSVYFWNSQSGLWYFYNPSSQQFVQATNPAEVLYRNQDAYQLSNGQYQWEKPAGNYGYSPTQGWVRFI